MIRKLRYAKKADKKAKKRAKQRLVQSEKLDILEARTERLAQILSIFNQDDNEAMQQSPENTIKDLRRIHAEWIPTSDPEELQVKEILDGVMTQDTTLIVYHIYLSHTPIVTR